MNGWISLECAVHEDKVVFTSADGSVMNVPLAVAMKSETVDNALGMSGAFMAPEGYLQLWIRAVQLTQSASLCEQETSTKDLTDMFTVRYRHTVLQQPRELSCALKMCPS